MVNLKLHMEHSIIMSIVSGNTRYVLCYLPDNRHTPFATWRVDAEGNCYWGHYTSDAMESATDYCERIGLRPAIHAVDIAKLLASYRD
jgi:hypothetical protein